MSVFHKILALVFLAAWLPTSNHCNLEIIGLMAADCCATEKALAENADCDDDTCQVLETTGFKFQVAKISVPAPAIFISFPYIFPEPSSAMEISHAVNWPAETFSLTQFRATTSLPARAPSLIS